MSMIDQTCSIIRLKSHCAVIGQDDGNLRLISLVNGMRCNFFHKDNYYSCRVAMNKPVMAPHQKGEIEVELIAFADVDISIGDKFELRAAEIIIAKCSVTEVVR